MVCTKTEKTMIPFPNVIAGALIGAINDGWLPRFLIPFGWAFVYLFYVSLKDPDRRTAHLQHAEKTDCSPRFGLSPMMAFYVIEYGTASVTSLIFSIIFGALRDLAF